MAERAVFLDRDGTLVKDPGYLNDPSQLKLLEGVPNGLIRLRKMGYKIVVVTNQSGVARGILTEKTLGRIHDKLKQMLDKEGAQLDGIYYCPYLEDGVIQRYRKSSELRKPRPGMLLKAAEEMDIDLNESWMIGDGEADVQAGKNAGCKTIFIDAVPKENKRLQTGVIPDYKAVNFQEAVNIIQKEQNFSAGAPEGTTEQVPRKPNTIQQPGETGRETTPDKPQYGNGKSGNDEIVEHLSRIHNELKKLRRGEMFSEFSIMRLFAGILQVVAGFCLLLGLWFLMSPGDSARGAEMSLWFAIAVQLMALTFYIMQERNK